MPLYEPQAWADDGTVVRLVDSTDEVVIGGTAALSSAKVSIDGDSDQIQLIVQGNSSQAANLVVFETSAGTDLMTFSNAGIISLFRSDASTGSGLILSQASTGDACMSWVLSGGQEFRAYLDNSDADSWKVEDITGSDVFMDYDVNAGTFNIGVIGNGTIGDSTERNWEPNTDLKINWGSSTKRFNEGWFAELHASANATADPVFTIQSTATNDDPTQITYQNRVATTDATVTTLHTFTVPTSTSYMITAYVIARRTGGVSGTAEDGAGYVIRGLYKNTAGTVALIGSVSADFTAESQAGWDATFTTSGATVLCRVTGAASNNITWHMTANIWQVAS